ncbi:MAG: porin [Hydrogenophaga sp.]|uniref:porin n=1 Tax=Hydrogenophaga sp. TaxID=1904254 RepID=UPI003D9B3D73
MKKTLIALAAVVATGAAFAQSSVTIDGAVDLGYVKPIGSKDARLDATNGANQIRFLGTEDLGGGLKAHFTLAQRFSPESGGNDGTTFARPTFQGESTVGLSGGFGAVKLGRALTAFQAPVNATDPWGTLQQASTAVLTSGYFTDKENNADAAGLGRTDAIHYSSPNFSGFSAAVSLGLKQHANSPAPLPATTKNLMGLWASYASGPLYVGGGMEQNRQDDQITAFLGTYNLGFMTVGGGFSQLDLAVGNDRKAWNIMAVAPMGAVVIKAGYGQVKDDVTGAKISKKLGLGVDYMLSKRTKVYASYGNEGARTTDKTGYDIGIRHTF